MTIQILDLIMYLVFLFITYKLLGEEYTEEMGGCIGVIVIGVYTIAYICFFWGDKHSWINIFNSFNIKW